MECLKMMKDVLIINKTVEFENMKGEVSNTHLLK